MEKPADNDNDNDDDDEAEAPDSERRAGPPRPAGPEVTAVSLPGLLGRMLLLLVVGLVAMLAASLLVVYVTGLAARRLGLPELPVMVTFLGLSVILAIALVGATIAGRIEQAGERLTSAVEDAGERVADEVSAASEELVEQLEELPMVVVAEPPKGTFPGGKGPRQARR